MNKIENVTLYDQILDEEYSDRFNNDNTASHSLLLGELGSGKTVSSELISKRLVNKKGISKVFFIDTVNGFKKFINNINGGNIDLEEVTINPLEMLSESTDTLDKTVELLTSLFNNLSKGNVNNEKKKILKASLKRSYLKFKEVKENPTLKTVKESLEEIQKSPEKHLDNLENIDYTITEIKRKTGYFIESLKVIINDSKYDLIVGNTSNIVKEKEKNDFVYYNLFNYLSILESPRYLMFIQNMLLLRINKLTKPNNKILVNIDEGSRIFTLYDELFLDLFNDLLINSKKNNISINLSSQFFSLTHLNRKLFDNFDIILLHRKLSLSRSHRRLLHILNIKNIEKELSNLETGFQSNPKYTEILRKNKKNNKYNKLQLQLTSKEEKLLE